MEEHDETNRNDAGGWAVFTHRGTAAWDTEHDFQQTHNLLQKLSDSQSKHSPTFSDNCCTAFDRSPTLGSVRMDAAIFCSSGSDTSGEQERVSNTRTRQRPLLVREKSHKHLVDFFDSSSLAYTLPVFSMDVNSS